MRLLIIGAGRAGGAIALAASRAGHEITGVLSRDGTTRFGPAFTWDDFLPEADLALIAVRDDSIEEVAGKLVEMGPTYPCIAHLSGFVPISALGAMASAGVSTGGFHPLQTLPDAETGAAALAGSHVGIGGDRFAVDVLTHLGGSMGMEPFSLEDNDRPAYHAAAASAANFVLTSLAVASDLFDSAGVDPVVARPLVEHAVSNAYDIGPEQSLTGPIARGDLETVIGHLTAAHQVSDEVGRQFRLLAEATAIRAGREEEVDWWS